jgi:superfamily I DNA and RNA helicase
MQRSTEPRVGAISQQLFLKLRQSEAKATIDCVGVGLIKNDAQAKLALALLEAYGDASEGFLYFEPCTARSTTRPPDAVLCTRDTGVVVVECKGYEIDSLQGVKAGSLLVKRRGRIVQESPISQVRDAMFAIKGPVDRLLGAQYGGPLFTYLVALPNITTEEWVNKKYDQAFPSDELLLGDQLNETILRRKIDTLVRTGLNESKRPKPINPGDVNLIKKVFGDSDVINREKRIPVGLASETLGLIIAENEASEKFLSAEQKSLCDVSIGGFPRVIRGVAGSGKTVVLAIQAARYVALYGSNPDLFTDRTRDIAVICFNRSLVPMLRKHVEKAYRQRTQENLPSEVRVTHINGLMYRLIDKENLFPLRYISTQGTTASERATNYIQQIDAFEKESPEHYRSVLLDAIFIDEGQDFEPEEYALLLRLLRPDPSSGEKTLIIFYDDAQNLYAKKRPVWKELGIDVQRGDRSRVMKECFRNTREIVQLAFNVLLGSASLDRSKVQTRTYSNVAELKQAGLVEEVDSHFQVNFAERTFDSPIVKSFASRDEERSWAMSEISRLIRKEHVQPEDILVLCHSTAECDALSSIVEGMQPPLVKGVCTPYARDEKDEFIFRDGCLTISTTNSAKGYDAQVVFLLGADQYSVEPEGRASFYVGVTRAKLLLYVTGKDGTGTLLQEAEKLLGMFGAQAGLPVAHTEMSEDLAEKPRSVGRSLPAQIQSSKREAPPAPKAAKSSEPNDLRVTSFKKGDRVVHPSYGIGVVVKDGIPKFLPSQKSTFQSVDVRFDQGTKTVVAELAGLIHVQNAVTV